MKIALRLAVAVFACVVSGCGSRPTHMYDGPQRPASEVAAIWTASVSYSGPDRVKTIRFNGVSLRKVDGVNTASLMNDAPYVVYVLPGKRVFTAQFFGSNEETRRLMTSDGFIEVEADVEAGKSYALDAVPDYKNKKVQLVLHEIERGRESVTE